MLYTKNLFMVAAICLVYSQFEIFVHDIYINIYRIALYDFDGNEPVVHWSMSPVSVQECCNLSVVHHVYMYIEQLSINLC